MEHITKAYGRRRVLHDVDLLLPSGSFTLAVGPNGSGKTTLLRLLASVSRPTSGTLHWGLPGGEETTEPAEARKRIGYSGHTPLVYDELTVEEHLVLQLRLRGLEPSMADAWLSSFGLEVRANDRADTLSRGLRQRLSLAQALAPQPGHVLLDEPGSNLDQVGLELLLNALRSLRRKATIVVATHDPDPFRPLADRTIEIHGGQVREWGVPS